MTDFLLELRSEEIPARMQVKAKEDLARLFNDALAKAGLAADSIETFATPRRLALIAKRLPLATEAVSEETKGPKVGAPPQAMEGFLRKTGLTQDQLVERDGVYFAVRDVPGRPTQEILGDVIFSIVFGFPWPKSMRWGDQSKTTTSLRWVRPLQGIVALFGDDVVPCEIDGIVSGSATKGHRFHHSGDITIGNAGDYIEKLRACHVIVHFSERCRIIREGADAAAKAAGLTLVEDDGLVAENAGLTEWPVPMLGRFDPAFLEVPEEVIQLTARVNQKYFVCHDKDGKLANAFVCTANIVANDGGAAIVAGNEKVLAARLSDAKFFWEQDLKVPLETQAKKLSQIVFHEKLGTVADKVERVAKLARWLVEEGIVTNTVRPEPVEGQEAQREGASTSSARTDWVALADAAKRAARLCKGDLVTGMVGEFPELQGIMGGYYARAQGESDAVADAIRDHYKPVGQGDEVPTAPITVAVSLADKLDTLVGFFAIKEKPTGSKDPFALRRAMLGIIETITQNHVRVGVREIVREAYRAFATQLAENRFVLWQDYDNDHRWSHLLGRDAAFKDGFGELVVLAQEPPLVASDWGDDGSQEWDPLDLRQRGLVDFEVCGFTQTTNEVTEFCFDRLRDREKRAGRRPDLISAVLPREIVNLFEGLEIEEERAKLPNTSANDDIVRILNLGRSLQGFFGTDEGGNLLAGYKRAANILKQSSPNGEGDHAKHGGGAQASDSDIEGGQSLDVPLHQPAAGSPPRAGEELALLTALDTAEPKAAAAVDAEDFEGAMAALAALRVPIDAFFEGVMVNDPDPDKRAFRLGLLARFRDAVHRVADFSKIEG